jgi:hypothetical protein
MKSTRLIMIASSIVLGVAGALLLFAPIESLSQLGFGGSSAIAGQILGSLYLACAAANWIARGSMIGGIYARPISIMNFVHFIIGATVLAKGISEDTLNVAYILTVFVYFVFAVLFILVLYGRLHTADREQP